MPKPQVQKSQCKAPFKAIGYTKDMRHVFLTQTGMGPGNQPMEFTLLWSPIEAMGIAKYIMEAAQECNQKQSPLILPKGVIV